MSKFIRTKYCNSISKVEANCIGHLSREEKIQKDRDNLIHSNHTKITQKVSK